MNTVQRRSAEPYYRAYLIGPGDRVERATELLAESDEEAMAQAQHLVNRQDVEVWDRGRFVVRLASENPWGEVCA